MLIGEIKFRILKALGNEPLHGYALARRLNVTISSIYNHLSELEGGGIAEHYETDKKKVYKLTEKGVRVVKAIRKS